MYLYLCVIRRISHTHCLAKNKLPPGRMAASPHLLLYLDFSLYHLLSQPVNGPFISNFNSLKSIHNHTETFYLSCNKKLEHRHSDECEDDGLQFVFSDVQVLWPDSKGREVNGGSESGRTESE